MRSKTDLPQIFYNPVFHKRNRIREFFHHLPENQRSAFKRLDFSQVSLDEDSSAFQIINTIVDIIRDQIESPVLSQAMINTVIDSNLEEIIGYATGEFNIEVRIMRTKFFEDLNVNESTYLNRIITTLIYSFDEFVRVDILIKKCFKNDRLNYKQEYSRVMSSRNRFNDLFYRHKLPYEVISVGGKGLKLTHQQES